MRKTAQRPLKSRLTVYLAVTAVCSTTVLGGGCKSSMPTWKAPSWSSFGFKREPSPDALAGVGPTATYPVSPSAGATPSAIQSIAASPSGTQPQTSQVATAGMNRPAGLPTGTGTLASSTNPSAAAANGFPTQSAGGPAVTPGSSYVYGKNPGATPATAQTAATPTYATAATPTRAPASNYAAVGYPMPGSSSSTATPSTSPAPAGLAAKPSAPSTPAMPTGGSATPPSLAGFAMPPITSGTTPSGSAPSTGGFVMPTQSSVATSTTTPAPGGFVMPPLGGKPVDSAPAARTASAPPSTPSSGASSVTPAGAYTPGSTSNVKSYPAASAGGTSDPGTFYR